jgi:hypothetical protein
LFTLSTILTIAAGLILLFAGRRALWLAAAMIVFIFAYSLLETWLGPGPFGLIAAAAAALIFALLAINFIRTISFLIGALAGALALPFLLSLFGVDISWWLGAIIGALLGIFIIGLALDWGLILMTSWVGAHVVSEQLTPILSLTPETAVALFFILFIAGLMIQASQVRRKML